MIFVLSDMRSGSTLLDQLLGAHPAIMSLGELHWLPAYVHQDRAIYDPAHELLCTCGETVQNCAFWRMVAAKLPVPLESLQLRPAFTRWGRENRRDWSPARASRRLVESLPALFRHDSIQRSFGGRQFVRDSLALFDAIFAVCGRPFAVDSSKSPYRFRAIHDSRPRQTRAVFLARDYRAVVHSKMKRGNTLESAALGWRNRMTQIEALTADLPYTTRHRVRYEDLCANPTQELTRICRFLGLDFSEDMLERPMEETHHIGGSPSKLDKSRVVISIDTAYQQAFDPPTLVRLRELVGPVAHQWDY